MHPKYQIVQYTLCLGKTVQDKCIQIASTNYQLFCSEDYKSASEASGLSV